MVYDEAPITDGPSSPLDRSSSWLSALRLLHEIPIDTEYGVIVDVEPTPAHRTAEVEGIKTMIDRFEAQFDIKPERLLAIPLIAAKWLIGIIC